MSITKFVRCSNVVFLVYFIQCVITSSDKNAEQQENVCQCPSIAPTLNTSNAENIKRARIFLVDTFWNKMDLSEKGNELRKIMLDLIRSDDTFRNEIALASTGGGWPYYVRREFKTNICVFAKLINATIPWQNNKDCSAVSTAIDDLIWSMQNGSYIVGSAGLKSTGCGSGELLFDLPNCFKNGTVYDIIELWDLNGSELPSKLREITMSLYESNDYFDNVLAAVTTASLSLPLRSTLIKLDPNVMFEILHGSASPKLPECCCPNYRNYMSTCMNIYDAMTAPLKLFLNKKAECA